VSEYLPIEWGGDIDEGMRQSTINMFKAILIASKVAMQGAHIKNPEPLSLSTCQVLGPLGRVR